MLVSPIIQRKTLPEVQKKAIKNHPHVRTGGSICLKNV